MLYVRGCIDCVKCYEIGSGSVKRTDMNKHRMLPYPVAALSYARLADWPSSKYRHAALHLRHDRGAIFLAHLGIRMHLGGTPFEAFGARA